MSHGIESKWLRKLLDRRIIIAMVFLCFIVGYGLTSRAADALARSGAVISALGFLLMSRGAILQQAPAAHIMIKPEVFSDDPKYYESEGLPVPPIVYEHSQNARAWNWGALVSAFGTLLWGFGDLPFK